MFSLIQSDIQRDPIMYTDPINERSSVIRGLLDLTHDLEIKTFDDLPTILALIEHGDKWEIPMVRKIIRQELQGRSHEKHERTASLFTVLSL
jgi:hypothetical protein